MSVSVERDQAFLDGVRQVADDVSAPNASAVDRDARFPVESISALREQCALSAFIPTELGGDGADAFAFDQNIGRVRSGAGAVPNARVTK